ncbi:hypothetical protein JCM8547_007032 [Rhodosporidiobolus lusitaniae]
MLNRLPLELVDLVLDVLPARIVRYEKRGRTQDLLSCCLVNKKLYERAVRLLWRDLYIVETGQASRLARTLADPAAYDRRDLVERVYIGGREVDAAAVTPLLTLFPALHSFEARTLQRKLNLDEVRAASAVFPLSAPLPPAMFSLFSQLDMLQLDAEDFHILPPTLFTSSTPTVFTVSLWDIPQRDGPSEEYQQTVRERVKEIVNLGPRRLRLVQGGSGSQQDFLETAKQLVLDSPQLQSVHYSAGFERWPRLHAPLKALRKACEARGVELHRFDADEEEQVVSPSFWRYAKELKVKQAAAGAHGQGM